MTSAPPVVRIVVADDHHVVRTGFAALLDTQPDFAVVGTAHDGTEAVRICRELSPDVVLMDVRMPVMDGIEATRQLAGSGPDRSPAPRILILTTFDLDSYVYDALCAGASGFLLKDVTAERLFEAVRVIAAGEALLAPAVTRRLISEFTRLRPRPEAPAAGALATLTPRETQVLRLVAEGLSNPEIATRLVVTEETVKTHVSRMLAKLGLRDRTQAVVTAYELGLIVPGSRDPGPSPGLSAAVPARSVVRHRAADPEHNGLAEDGKGQRGAVEHQGPAGCGATPIRTPMDAPDGHSWPASACCISSAHKTACFALANATKNASPCVSISWPACLAMASRTGSGAPPALVHTVPAGPLPAGSNPKRTPHRGKCPRCGHQCRYRVRCISHQGKVSMVPVVIACFPDHRPARHLCCRRNARDSMSARSRWAHRGPAGRRRRAGRPHAPGAG